MIADVAIGQPRAEKSLRAEKQHEHQAGDDRRHGKGQLEECDEDPAPSELEARERPGRGHTEDQVERNHDQRRHQREADGVPRLGLADGAKIGVQPLGEGLREDRGQRHEEEGRQEQQGDGPERKGARTP